MKQPRIPRNAKRKKPRNVLSAEKFNASKDDIEELEAIRAYDSAKEEGGTPIPYEQVLRRIERSRG
jgi:hypothetical protein